ncbi:MAG TPA: histidine kinase [Rhodocyclaceae bacterium]|nr:MAG: histidine kinase [Betaproteobacteria bacterium CG2_30_68_42]PIV75613.1 MAG: histidine kinase [Rhodocyclales bacterium CG17_big_fil_post_rev_8_21_14_2_50_68_7]PJA58760.1 MAG: histidine kinase [Rhodocyclales bacterium CG_4_9_14_3_um_filter_68_10]HCX32168.1 histidine kinase [Rhodocyclaceae bacterium]
MTIVRQLLNDAHRHPIRVSTDDLVYTALELMAKHNIGSVLVFEGERFAGIFTERDYARKLILFGRSSKEMKVREIMTSQMVYVAPNRTVEECMALVTEKRVRHLPVLDDDGTLMGLISIGDLVKSVISEKQFEIDQLIHYIKS